MVNYVLFSLEMHQPYRIKSTIDPRAGLYDVLDEELDRLVLERVAEKSYRPVLKILGEEFDKITSEESYKPSINISISGVLLEQFSRYAPDIIDLLRDLVSGGYIEFLAEPYYHSLASELSKEEFIEQIKLSIEALNKLFNYSPIGAVNTEMIYRSDVGRWLRELGFKYTVTEGVERIFLTRDPNNLYQDSSGILLFARQYRLSDDIAFRFSMTSWDQYPLTADKYASWIKDSPGDFVVVYVDFETFGEHHWPVTGILEFLRYLPREFSKRDIKMISFSEAIKLFRPIRELSIDETISWANERKDLSAWLGNELQRRAFELYKWVSKSILESNNRDLLTIWRVLGEADHYHYLYYTRDSSLAVHDYFSYHENPFIAFETYAKALMVLYYYSRRI
ncbi:MAG: glycoside hydrolase family 57 protein [Sulfolobales archaeon]